jgi:DNA mismatch repair protein MutS
LPTQPTSAASVHVAQPKPTFASILFDDSDGVVGDRPPDYFTDLNLDQLVTSILTGRDEYDLASFFHTPLTARDAVAYRQDILRDLERPPVADCIASFAEDMRQVRNQLAKSGRMRFDLQRQAWLLAAALRYVAAMRRLAETLPSLPISSDGLAGFRGFLSGYVSSGSFRGLEAEAMGVQRQIDGVTYRLRVSGDTVEVSFPQDEADYAADVLASFARFQQGPVKSYRSRLQSYEEMNHVEEAIAVRVAKLYPKPFAALEAFCSRQRGFVSEVVSRFDREIQFYLAYLEFVRRMRAAGLAMCYPAISDATAPLEAVDAYDVALADKLVGDDRSVVANDVGLTGRERIWVITGPNQGGKTTYARMIGQLHHLGGLGLLVPGSRARLPLPDRIFTHFERGENLHDLTGKLDDDLVRIRDILQAATPASLLIMNEIFTSTSLEDAVWLSTKVLHQVIEKDCLCVCVTFLDELSTLSPSTVSMVSTIAAADPANRTFKIIRRKADGRAYAEAIAERHGLTARALKRRLPS